MFWLFLGFLAVTVISQASLYWVWPTMGLINVISVAVILYTSEDTMKEIEKRTKEREQECQEQQG